MQQVERASATAISTNDPLTLKRASDQWQHEDYDVLADGKVVGRIYEDASASTPPELRWLWSVTSIVPAIPNRTNGHAPTLDEAKAKFRDNWTKAKTG